MSRNLSRSSKRAKLSSYETDTKKKESAESKKISSQLSEMIAVENGPTNTTRPGPVATLDFCPLCQFPFKHLIGQTESWHVNECFEREGINKSIGEPKLNSRTVQLQFYYCWQVDEGPSMRGLRRRVTVARGLYALLVGTDAHPMLWQTYIFPPCYYLIRRQNCYASRKFLPDQIIASQSL